jgi:Protein of unknown function (DUF433)
MGGTPVFCGTRVPVRTLFDYLEAGDSIDEFLAGFPSVTRAQVIGFPADGQKLARQVITVIPGLDPGISWMAGSSPAMTSGM